MGEPLAPHVAAEAFVYRANGFALQGGCLTPAVANDLARAFDEAMAGAVPFNQHGSGGSRLLSYAEDHPTLAGLAASPTLLARVEAVLRRPALFLGAFLLDNRDDTPWHTAGLPGEEPESLRASIHLDSADPSGRFSVIPGSHHPEYSRALFAAYGRFEGRGVRLALPPEGAPGSVAFPPSPRDVLLWDPRLWHAAPRRDDGKARRGIFLTYLPDPGEDRVEVERARRAFSARRSYDRPWVYGASLAEHASIRAMGERLEQIGVTKVWPPAPR